MANKLSPKISQGMKSSTDELPKKNNKPRVGSTGEVTMSQRKLANGLVQGRVIALHPQISNCTHHIKNLKNKLIIDSCSLAGALQP